MPRSSANSAGATYLDRPHRIDALRRAARQAAAGVPSTRRVILFGSLATGAATPRSDADILMIVDTSEHRHPRDRIPDVLRAMAPLPCPIDLFVLTSEEAERARHERNPLVLAALSTGVDLLEPKLSD